MSSYFLLSYVPKIPCSQGSIFLGSYVPRILCSFQGDCAPRVLWCKQPMSQGSDDGKKKRKDKKRRKSGEFERWLCVWSGTFGWRAGLTLGSSQGCKVNVLLSLFFWRGKVSWGYRVRYSWSEDATQLQVQPASSLIIFLFFHFHVRLKFFHRERVLRPVQLVWRSVKSQARPASSPLGCFRITLSTLKKKK